MVYGRGEEQEVAKAGNHSTKGDIPTVMLDGGGGPSFYTNSVIASECPPDGGMLGAYLARIARALTASFTLALMHVPLSALSCDVARQSDSVHSAVRRSAVPRRAWWVGYWSPLCHIRPRITTIG